MRFFDTNVLLYSVSTDPTEAGKRQRALALLDGEEGALSVQVLQEFYYQATRPSRPEPLPHDIAVDLVTGWTRFRVQEVNLSILTDHLQTSVFLLGQRDYRRGAGARLRRTLY